MNDQQMDEQIAFAKKHIASLASDLMQGGIADLCVFAALGSVMGNIAGLNFPKEEDQRRAIAEAAEPMLADAKRGAALKAAIVGRQ